MNNSHIYCIYRDEGLELELCVASRLGKEELRVRGGREGVVCGLARVSTPLWVARWPAVWFSVRADRLVCGRQAAIARMERVSPAHA
jgi:hypothetical protein